MPQLRAPRSAGQQARLGVLGLSGAPAGVYTPRPGNRAQPITPGPANSAGLGTLDPSLRHVCFTSLLVLRSIFDVAGFTGQSPRGPSNPAQGTREPRALATPLEAACKRLLTPLEAACKRLATHSNEPDRHKPRIERHQRAPHPGPTRANHHWIRHQRPPVGTVQRRPLDSSGYEPLRSNRGTRPAGRPAVNGHHCPN